MRRGLESSLREVLADAPAVQLGTVEEVEQFGGGYLVSGSLQPSGEPFQARMLFGPIGSATGDLFPVAVGDEVVILYPAGEPNRAVALWGGNSSAAKLPSSFTNNAPRLVHPSGKTFATSETATTQAVTTVDLLPDLQAAMTEIVAMFAALASLGITLPSTNTANLVSKLAASYRSKAVFTE